LNGLRSGGLGAGEQGLSLACVSRHPARLLELGARFLLSPESGEEVAADGGEEVVVAQRRLATECVDEMIARRRRVGYISQG
jgi:hypothetical protein